MSKLSRGAPARPGLPLWSLAFANLMVAPAAARAEPVRTSSAASTRTGTASLSEEDLRAIESAFGPTSEGAALPPSESAESAPAAVPRVIQSLIPDIALLTDVALGWFSKPENLQGGGHDPTERGFTLQQAELTLSSNVDPYFRLNANFVFTLEGVEVEEAYGTTLALPFGLQARCGMFLTRFGRMNPTHPHAWYFIDQPFALTRLFGGDGNRGVGAELSWLLPLPWSVELLASTNMPTGEETARSFRADSGLGVQSVFDLEYVGALKQYFPFDDDLGLALGLSTATGPGAAEGDRASLYGVDAYLRYRPVSAGSYTVVTLESEWMYRRRALADDLLQDYQGYTQVQWLFLPRWSVAGRFELGTKARGRLETSTDPLDPEWTRSRDRTTLALSYFPTEFSRLRIQGSVDRPRWLDEPIYAAFLQVELGIGAHAAHAF